MAVRIDSRLTARALRPRIERLFELSAGKILAIERQWESGKGAPVFTIKGAYAARGWTEWTQGFQYGSAILQFDATGDERFLDLGRRATLERMTSHVSHVGVHDHGFNIVSTHGNLWRLMREGKLPSNERERQLYELALKVSGAVQAARWTATADGRGFIYSFNGPHSLFIDTLRSLRSLAVAHQLGHVLMGERDRRISLLDRLISHAGNTIAFNVYFGEGRDRYDVRGRTAHEALFNVNDGAYRCPSTQQGYSPFSTWTRGLAWAICGFAEQLEFFQHLVLRKVSATAGGGDGSAPLPLTDVRSELLRAAVATSEFYIENACADGIPVWDTGAPDLDRLGSYLEKPSDPFNGWEPVDSSAAAIAAQGLLRLGNYLTGTVGPQAGARYRQAALTIARTLFSDPYLSTSPHHQGLILHSVYHRPNAWDYVHRGQKVPNGESSMWGDYHARELGVLLLRETTGECYPAFFDYAGSESPQPGDSRA